MSQNYSPRNIKFTVKVGSTRSISVDVTNDDNTPVDFSNTTTYNTVKFRVWQPDGTMIINTLATYATPRTSGIITYSLTSTDTALGNTGNWEGDCEMYDINGNISDNSDTFNFTILSP